MNKTDKVLQFLNDHRRALKHGGGDSLIKALEKLCDDQQRFAMWAWADGISQHYGLAQALGYAFNTATGVFYKREET